LKTIIYIYVFLNFKGMHMGRINWCVLIGTTSIEIRV
jgi:hypothetical protein